ncbi:hypothetical protein [Culicoidibacter larvae]|uniref:Uncharacterized protein n=1 Tax=Culicoidibacter larvae TaxID=2579976 RepID=A0A5R8Q7V4_9FIRM|nr:hypothetical protein [Culicoidibacter larvae]TLG71185.1 hypothetical protein FEZ08_11565 [Culicoidibacter larvae]
MKTVNSNQDGPFMTLGYNKPITVSYWLNDNIQIITGYYNNHDRKPGHINISGVFIQNDSIIDIK